MSLPMLRDCQYPGHADRVSIDSPSLGQTTTTKDVYGVVGDITLESGRLHLEESNLSG